MNSLIKSKKETLLSQLVSHLMQLKRLILVRFVLKKGLNKFLLQIAKLAHYSHSVILHLLSKKHKYSASVLSVQQ